MGKLKADIRILTCHAKVGYLTRIRRIKSQSKALICDRVFDVMFDARRANIVRMLFQHYILSCRM
jgi:hypothetical protein